MVAPARAWPEVLTTLPLTVKSPLWPKAVVENRNAAYATAILLPFFMMKTLLFGQYLNI